MNKVSVRSLNEYFNVSGEDFIWIDDVKNYNDFIPWNVGISPSEDTKKMISQSLKGRKVSEETKRKLSNSLKNNKNGKGNKGKKHSKEFCDAIAKRQTKPDNEITPHALWMRKYREQRPKYNNEEWKEISKQKRIKKQTKKYKITFENGNSIIVDGLIKFAKDNGYSSGIFNVMNGTYKKHKDIVSVEKLDTPS